MKKPKKTKKIYPQHYIIIITDVFEKLLVYYFEKFGRKKFHLRVRIYDANVSEFQAVKVVKMSFVIIGLK